MPERTSNPTVLQTATLTYKEVQDDIWLVSFMGLYRSGGKDSAAVKQPFWSQGVKYVFGTFCKGCLRTVHCF
jgi:hypothetical protein